MTEDQIIKWLPLVGTAAEGKRKNWVKAKCPLAKVRHQRGTDHDPSFGIKIEPGESRVWCFSCSFGGKQSNLVGELQRNKLPVDFTLAMEAIVVAEEGGELDLGDGDYEADVFGPVPEVHVFDELLVEVFPKAYGSDWKDLVHPYLISRSVPYEVAAAWDLLWDPVKGRVLFPVRDWEGRLRGLHGRSVRDGGLPYLMYPYQEKTNPDVWLGEHLCDQDEPVVMAESVFDLARVYELYENTISPLTASLSPERLHRVRGLTQVATLFDSGPAGDRARTRVTQALPDASIQHLVPPDGEDAGSMTLEDLDELLNSAGLYSPMVL